MGKVKLTKGELKYQRDALAQYQRYLPTLVLKKQQLQIEILHQLNILNQKKHATESQVNSIKSWAGLLSEGSVNLKDWLKPEEVFTGTRNIAGVDLPVFERLEYKEAVYDLFLSPLWVDAAIESLRNLVSLRQELKVLEKGIGILRAELRVTSQRVNLFEKVKIPEAEETIRLIKIYIGDQMTNAVGRSKIAKRKIEALVPEGAGV